MKSLLLIVTMTIVSISSYCQVPPTAMTIDKKEYNDYFFNKKNIPVVKGKITHLTEELQKVRIMYSIVSHFNPERQMKKLKVNADGTFELEIDYAFPYQQIWFSWGNLFHASLYANTDLFIEIDAKQLQKNRVRYVGAGVTYQGTDAGINYYMNKHFTYKKKQQRKIRNYISGLYLGFNMEHNSIIEEHDSLHNLLNKIDDEFIAQNKSEYAWLLKNERTSEYYSFWLVKHIGKTLPPELFERIKNHRPALTTNNSASYYNDLYSYLTKNRKLNNAQNYASYTSYSAITPSTIAQLDSILTIEHHKNNKRAYDTTKYDRLIKQVNLALRDTIVAENAIYEGMLLDSLFDTTKADCLKLKISSRKTKDNLIRRKAIIPNIKTEWCKHLAKEAFKNANKKKIDINEILRNTKPLLSDKPLGEPIEGYPTDTHLYITGKLSAQQLLANLKHSFEGKALLIHFWSTSCRPCIMEMRFNQKLLHQTKDLPIEYVYLGTSPNSGIETWKAKITRFELKGTHIFLEEEVESELMRLFSFSGFPNYAFINKSGEYLPKAVTRITILNKDKIAELVK